MAEVRKRREHYLTLEVKSHDPVTRQGACDAIHSWLETYGHTSTGHGFDFVAVSADWRRKRMKKQPK